MTMTLDDNKILETLIEIKSQLAELNANQKNLQAILVNHENRIISIESSTTKEKTSLKDDLIQILVKGIVGSIFVIGSLAGAGGIIAKIFGN